MEFTYDAQLYNSFFDDFGVHILTYPHANNMAQFGPNNLTAWWHTLPHRRLRYYLLVLFCISQDVEFRHARDWEFLESETA
jgi:hypothetical protein